MDPIPYEPPVCRIPMPSDFKDEDVASLMARANSYTDTAEAIADLLGVLNLPLPEPTEGDRAASLGVFQNMTAATLPTIRTTAAAMHLTALLKEFDMQVVQDAQQIRNLCVNRLLHLAVEAKTEGAQLRAIELLGKTKDVGLFEERTVVLVEDMDTVQLKQSLREKINRVRLLAAHSDVVDAEGVRTIDTPADTPPQE